MNTPRAIETQFDGCLFRSRLEARWALLFKELGIPYRYEPEAFDLDGTPYLPDFYISRWEAWIEIKPDWPGWEAVEKVNLLHEHTQRTCLLIWGDIWPPQQIAVWRRGEPWDGVFLYNSLATCRRCEEAIWLLADSDLSRGFNGAMSLDSCSCEGLRMPLRGTTIQAAYTAARSARFDGWWRKRTGSDLQPRRAR